MEWNSGRVEKLIVESQEFVSQPGVANGFAKANPFLLAAAVELRLGKDAAALRKISLARFNSKFSRSSSFGRSRSDVVGPGTLPVSCSTLRIQERRASVEQSTFSEIDLIAVKCEV